MALLLDDDGLNCRSSAAYYESSDCATAKAGRPFGSIELRCFAPQPHSIFDGIRTAVSYSLVLVVAVEMFIGLVDRGHAKGGRVGDLVAQNAMLGWDTRHSAENEAIHGTEANH